MMFRRMYRIFALGICLMTGAVATPSLAQSDNASIANPVTEEKRIMVMIKLGPEHFRASGDYAGDYGDAMSQAVRLRFAKKIAKEYGLKIVDNWPMQVIGIDCVIMAVDDDRSTQAIAEEISKIPGVEWSQQLNEFKVQGTSGPAYNDNLYAAQPVSSRWHLSSLHRYTTGRGISIAIVDSRIDISHPDFAGQKISVQDFVPGNRKLAEQHGTGVAGIIAARPNNAMGIAGVAPAARILGLRACWERTPKSTAVCDTLSLAKALTSAIDSNVDIVNLSLTGPHDPLLTKLVGVALGRGISVVAAVDINDPSNSFPASIKGVIRVADEHLSARESGVYIAPGRDVPTTKPEGKWSLVNGSSYATAHVSGLVALLKQLSGPRHSRLAPATALGPTGSINACAAVARLSALDALSCRPIK